MKAILRFEPGALPCHICEAKGYIRETVERPTEMKPAPNEWVWHGLLFEGDEWDFELFFDKDGKQVAHRFFCPDHRRLLFCVQWERYHPDTQTWTAETDYAHARDPNSAMMTVFRGTGLPPAYRKHVATAVTIGVMTRDEGKTLIV